MAHVTLLCGPAGAGKTTIARELEAEGAVVLSFDRAAWAMGVRDGRPSRAQMEAADAALSERLAEAVADGRDVVVDASMSVRWVRDQWRERAEAAGVTWALVVVTAPLSVLAARVAAREAGEESVQLDPKALEAYVAGFEWPAADEPHELRVTA